MTTRREFLKRLVSTGAALAAGIRPIKYIAESGLEKSSYRSPSVSPSASEFPSYSTDIAAAWQVVEKLTKQKGKGIDGITETARSR